jgi:hypothetical protein
MILKLQMEVDMTLGNAFLSFGHDLKIAAEDVDHAFVKVFITLFGLQEWQSFAQAAEALFKTQFGQVLEAAASKLIAGLEAGTPVAKIIEQVVVLVISEGASAGLTIGQEIAQFLASLVLSKVSGSLASATLTPAKS